MKPAFASQASCSCCGTCGAGVGLSTGTGVRGSGGKAEVDVVSERDGRKSLCTCPRPYTCIRTHCT